MNIKSSAEFRNNYRKFADFCKVSGEPVFLTNNGEGELVVMSIETYNELQTRLKIERDLLYIESYKTAGKMTYTDMDDFFKEADAIISEAENCEK